MASTNKNLSAGNQGKLPSGKGKKFGIVVANYYATITDALLAGAKETLLANGLLEKDILVENVPGAFELPLGALTLFERHKLDGVICIGCVIKGETDHDKYINQTVAQSIGALGLQTGKPFVYGVLTPNNMEQALARAGGKHGNKGVEAAVTVLKMSALVKGKQTKIGF